MNPVLKGIINFTAVLIIFSDAFALWVSPWFELRFAYIAMLLLIGVFFCYKRYSFNRVFSLLLLAFMAAALFPAFWGDNRLVFVFKQGAGIFISAFFFYQVIKLNEGNIRGIFRFYVRIAALVGIIGILQELAYLFKLNARLYNFAYWIPKWYPTFTNNYELLRVNSILTEPASFCIAMLPATFAAMSLLFVKRNNRLISFFEAGVILTAVFLTLSSIGFLALFISIAVLIRRFLRTRQIIMGAGVLAVVAISVYLTLPPVRLRVGDSIAVLTGQSKIEQTNLSTFTWFTNAVITGKVISKSPFLGNGLGSHPVTYRKYISDVFGIIPNQLLLNQKDANSLFLRLLSETGIFGLAIFLYFMVRFHIRRYRDMTGYLWIINNSVFVLFIIRLIRQGNYFSEGFFFFLWVYYFSKKSLLSQTEIPVDN